MEEETTVAPTSEEQEGTQEETEETETEEEEVDWKSEAQKAKELADNYKRRAEKAEQKAKSAPKVEVTGELSHADIIFLAKTDIADEDINEVTDFAKLKGIPVKDAYNYLKPVLSVRAEERQTAQVTATKGARGKKPTSGEDLLRKAKETGEIPTSDAAMQELILAKQNARRRK